MFLTGLDATTLNALFVGKRLSFDDFVGSEILTERQSQDYRSVYLDLSTSHRLTRPRIDSNVRPRNTGPAKRRRSWRS
jgi:Type I restriction and modification enzyme - subunit R C terminal